MPISPYCILPLSSRKEKFTFDQYFLLQVLFQIALATLDANRAKLLAVEDDGEAMTVLGNYLEHVTNRDSSMQMPSQQISNRNAGLPHTGVCTRPIIVIKCVIFSNLVCLLFSLTKSVCLSVVVVVVVVFSFRRQ